MAAVVPALAAEPDPPENPDPPETAVALPDGLPPGLPPPSAALATGVITIAAATPMPNTVRVVRRAVQRRRSGPQNRKASSVAMPPSSSGPAVCRPITNLPRTAHRAGSRKRRPLILPGHGMLLATRADPGKVDQCCETRLLGNTRRPHLRPRAAAAQAACVQPLFEHQRPDTAKRPPARVRPVRARPHAGGDQAMHSLFGRLSFAAIGGARPVA